MGKVKYDDKSGEVLTVGSLVCYATQNQFFRKRRGVVTKLLPCGNVSVHWAHPCGSRTERAGELLKVA